MSFWKICIDESQLSHSALCFGKASPGGRTFGEKGQGRTRRALANSRKLNCCGKPTSSLSYFPLVGTLSQGKLA